MENEEVDKESYPPIIDNNLNFYDQYENKMRISNFQEIEVCVACEVKLPCIAKPHLSYEKLNVEEVPNLNLLKLQVKDEIGSTESITFYHENDKLDGLCISKKGISINEKQETVVTICSDCLGDLQKAQLPKFSLANNFYTGNDVELPGKNSDFLILELTWIEKMCISRVRFSRCVVKLTQTKLLSQLAFKGHVIVKAQNPDPLLTIKLPLRMEELGKTIHVIFINRASDINESQIGNFTQIFTIRRQCIEKWLIHLKKYHPDYSSVEIDKDILSDFSEDGILQNLIDNATYTNDDDAKDLQCEIGVNGERNHFEGSITSIYQCQKSFIVDDSGSTVPMNDIYDYLQQSLKPTKKKQDAKDAIAMIPGSAFLKTNSPNFFRMAFPTLYPFGIGHPSERTRHVDFDDEIQHRLCQYDSKFRDNFLFQFLSYDMILKKQLFKSVNLRTKNLSQEAQEFLSTLTVEDLEKAIDDRAKGVKNDTNSRLNNHIYLAGGKIPFSRLSKRANKAQLNSMIINRGAPSLYITISPDDLKNPLCYLMCLKDPKDFDINSPKLKDAYVRSSQTARNSNGVSEFFHTIIQNIIDNVFGWKNENQAGVFGKLKAYYGMVETQNRGTLHIHLLLWIDGALSPLDLYDKLKSDDVFRESMLQYASKIINTDIPFKPRDIETNYGNLSCGEDCTLMKDYGYEPLVNVNSEEFEHEVAHRLLHAINTYQLHSHTPSCFTNPRIRGCR